MCDVEIRQVRADDVSALTRALGQEAYFADCLDRQGDERGILLAAWRDGDPIGDVYLRLEKAEEWEILRRLPGVPLLTHLEVLSQHRNHGVGTKLIAATERTARELGRRRIALAVELRNSAAARLYDRLGYAEWDHAAVMCFAREDGPNGSRIRRPEWCRILVKELTGQSVDLQRVEHVRTG